MFDYPVIETLPTIVGGNGHRHALAIVGSHPATRELAPYEDSRFDILLFNEAAQKPQVYKRWDMLLQIHLPEVYRSEYNWVNKDHWQFLQEKRGKPIYMQHIDPDVPDSVEYPLDGILQMVPFHYLRSSPAMGLALGIYLGYDEIWLYGSELTSNTEYSYQATNYAFWIGFAVGKGIDLHLECWQAEFNQPIYGYEGELQISQDYFTERFAEHEKTWKLRENTLSKLKNRLDNAMLENDYAKTGELSINAEDASQSAGEAYARMGEAARYGERTNPISRQEFERKAAQAQQDGDELRTKKYHEGGKCEYVWNVWKQTGDYRALSQLRAFLTEKNRLAYEVGSQFGIFTENMQYLAEYDSRLQAAGGVRALGKPEVKEAI
jgi:hypothetical protein